jgi:hypothetical protein
MDALMRFGERNIRRKTILIVYEHIFFSLHNFLEWQDGKLRELFDWTKCYHQQWRQSRL